MKCHGAGAAMGAGEGGHHTMPGLPDWALYLALLAALLMTGWVITRRRGLLPAALRQWRLELTAWAPVQWALSRRAFQFSVQLPLVLTLALVLTAGFRGSPVADRNIATVLTWTVWWTLLVVDIVLLGRMWCLVCPWEALASWLRRLAFWRRTDEPLTLNLPWPRWLRNIYPATVLFVGLTWLELGWGVTLNPRATAYLGVLMVMLAVLPALIFERRSFCKYGCLVGRICGLYSMVAPVELRARDTEVCRSCKTLDCLRGNEKGYPCPTGLCPGTLEANTYCTLCTECVKTCPEQNIAVNLRPWGSDLHSLRKPRRDEALLAVVMLSMTSFHGLTMTPAWTAGVSWLRGLSGMGYLATFTVGMALILVVPGLIYLAVSALGSWLHRSGSAEGRVWRLASAYAYPLIAVALMYHLAHNAGHFLVEAGALLPVLSDPLGIGMDLIGTAAYMPTALAGQGTIWSLQVALVLVGHVMALGASERSRWTLVGGGDGTATTGGTLTERLAPAAFTLLATAANLWLLAQPMEMRTGM